MSFDWADYLVLAKGLATDPGTPGPCEAALRSAASRAYYSAFQCALDFACREGFQASETGQDHKDVQDHFRGSTRLDKTRGHIATELGRLLKHRTQADYKSTLDRRASSLATQAVRMAFSVLSDLDSL
jgi:uncharacterized protein (UPF0332 family)